MTARQADAVSRATSSGRSTAALVRRGESRSGGKIVAHVPHGLENVQLDLMTNEHHALRWRKAKDGPLSRNRTIMLGTLDHDVKGIEIVHYNAPILIVKAETKANKPVSDLKVSAHYTRRTGSRLKGR